MNKQNDQLEFISNRILPNVFLSFITYKASFAFSSGNTLKRCGCSFFEVYNSHSESIHYFLILPLRLPSAPLQVDSSNILLNRSLERYSSSQVNDLQEFAESNLPKSQQRQGVGKGNTRKKRSDMCSKSNRTKQILIKNGICANCIENNIASSLQSLFTILNNTQRLFIQSRKSETSSESMIIQSSLG